MFLRIVSSLVGLPILIFLIVLGGLPLRVAILAVSLIGLAEFYSAFKGKVIMLKIIGILVSLLYYLPMYMTFNSFMFLNSFFIFALLISMVVRHRDIAISDCALIFFGFYYTVVPLSFIYMVRMSQFGEYLVWLIFICAWGSDTGAYFTGRSLGKHKLTPSLSPNKTVEGAIGGVVVATILAFIYGLIITRMRSNVDIAVNCAIIGAVGAVLSQFGDLAASAIKRQSGVKDFGNLIPGHGGVLDRFDSIIFTAPCVYIVMTALMR